MKTGIPRKLEQLDRVEQQLVSATATVQTRRGKIKVRRYSDSKRPHLKFVVNYREAGKVRKRKAGKFQETGEVKVIRKREFFESKESASAFAAFKNAELKKNGVEGAEFPTSLRTMAQNAIEDLKPFGKTITDAVKYYVDHLKASEKSCTAKELVDELVAAKKADGASQRHVDDLRSRLNIFAEKFNGQMVATITSAEIDDWLRSLEVSPVTRNHYRRLIILAFNFAMDRGYVPYAPKSPADKTAKVKEPKKDVGILTVTQAARLLESTTPDVLPYFAIGLFAGLRRSELERLDWSEIDFESGLIKVKGPLNSKSAARRFVTMQPNLHEWLLPLRKHKGNVTPDETAFRQGFDQARVAAGIVEWPDNGLRHSFGSYHLGHFNNAALTALQMGHADVRITIARYRELVKPKDAASYWNIAPAASEKKIVQLAAHA